MYDHIRFIGPMQSEGGYNTYAAQNGQNDQPWVCNTCGVRPTTKITSGTPECAYCWDWRKLDGPAAKHWVRVAGLFTSNIDMHDYNNFMPRKVGITQEEFSTAIKVADKIFEACMEMIKEHSVLDDVEEKTKEKIGWLYRNLLGYVPKEPETGSAAFHSSTPG